MCKVIIFSHASHASHTSHTSHASHVCDVKKDANDNQIT